jgi:hypothetical protein
MPLNPSCHGGNHEIGNAQAITFPPQTLRWQRVIVSSLEVVQQHSAKSKEPSILIHTFK